MVCGSYSSANTGLDCEFVRGRREGLVNGIRVIEFDLSYSNTDNFIRRSMTFLKFSMASIGVALRENYDVAFATTTPLTAGIPGIFARWLRRKPFVFEVRDLWPEMPREMGVITNPVVLFAMSVLEWVSYHSANRCVALSPGIEKGIQKCGILQSKIVMVPNGCDIEIFAKEDVIPWRPAGVQSNDLMVVYAGTHGLTNGLDAIVDAANELKNKRQNNIKIVLIGDGTSKSSLLLRARELSLENLIFIAPVPKVKLVGLLRSADLGIQCLANFPGFYDGTSPNKFFDYIAAGLPVLNNYPGWVANIITKNDCGWVAQPDDADNFASILIDISKNRASLTEKGQNARELAMREFNRDDLADQWVQWVVGVSDSMD